MTEDQLEQQCLHWFAEGGWEVGYGPDLAPDGTALERVEYRQVLLLADLEAAWSSCLKQVLPPTIIYM